MAQVTLLQPNKQLSELIAAANRGEEVVIRDGDQAPVKLVPVSAPRGPRKAGSAKGKIIMADDFDAPLEDFKEYM
jgi:antitoxin (DNA-binding transcriptional repressor) of toxin-antitoxin stability system